MESKQIKNKKDLRNKFDALRHILKECTRALAVLCRLQQEEEEITKEINSRCATGRGYGDIPILKQALICLLCVRVKSLFDDNKRGISFKNFLKLKKNPIIKDMISTRNTWFAHMDRDINKGISAREICDSDLKEQLENLESLWVDIYLSNK